MNPKAFEYFDDEEKELIEPLENGEWKSVPNLAEEIKLHEEYAWNTLRLMEKEKAVVRLKKRDLDRLKVRASKLGLTPQKAVQMLLTQFAQGKIDLDKSKYGLLLLKVFVGSKRWELRI